MFEQFNPSFHRLQIGVRVVASHLNLRVPEQIAHREWIHAGIFEARCERVAQDMKPDIGQPD
jgi:hypothetical protein